MRVIMEQPIEALLLSIVDINYKLKGNNLVSRCLDVRAHGQGKNCSGINATMMIMNSICISGDSFQNEIVVKPEHVCVPFCNE